MDAAIGWIVSPPWMWPLHREMTAKRLVKPCLAVGRRLVMAMIMFGFSPLPSAAAMPTCGQRPPVFKDYPAVVAEGGKKRPPLKRNKAFAHRYQTLLGGALKAAKVTLAGHYVTTSFGCGTSCVLFGAVDILTGEAWELTQLTPLDEKIDTLHMRADSRLVVSVDFADGHPSPRVTRYFEWRQGRLRPVCRDSTRP
ncbi:MAG: hypothetical protein HQM02_10550 [Magnetococcales bacterium]|nr:hypothetical protein [Magnetococcales bacterium]